MAAQESIKSTCSAERDSDESQHDTPRTERKSYGSHFAYSRVTFSSIFVQLCTRDCTVKPVIALCNSQNNVPFIVHANKEVILSAGTINSPQLLLLSGIGPKNNLDSVNIRTVVNLRGVGENLHNHQSYGLDFTLTQPNVKELNINNADLYLYNQTGPMSSTGLAQLTGILVSNYTTSSDPDIQVFFAGYQAVCNTGTRIPDLISFGNKETVRFSSVNLQPRSRGK